MKKLTNALIKRRRAIALDVVAQVKSHKFVAECGTYVYLEGVGAVRGELQPFLKKTISAANPCTVCGIGSAAISAIGLYDNFKVRSRSSWAVEGELDSRALKRLLRTWFSKRELGILESVFEVSDDWLQPDHGGATAPRSDIEGWHAASEFITQMENLSAEERLVWIMETIAKLAGKRFTFLDFRNEFIFSLATNPLFATYRDNLSL